MTKCIGGKFDGEWRNGVEKHVLMRKSDFPGISALDSRGLNDTPMDATSTMDIIHQYYTLRSVRCSGCEIVYYAPEEWSDEEAIRHALT